MSASNCSLIIRERSSVDLAFVNWYQPQILNTCTFTYADDNGKAYRVRNIISWSHWRSIRLLILFLPRLSFDSRMWSACTRAAQPPPFCLLIPLHYRMSWPERLRQTSRSRARETCIAISATHSCILNGVKCVRIHDTKQNLLPPLFSPPGEFAQSSSVNQWVNLAIMSAWVIWLRLAHFCMIYRGILPYRNAMAVPASSVKA